MEDAAHQCHSWRVMDFDSPYNEINEIDAFLADSVVVADGKIYAQGAGWNIINTPTVPFRYSRIGVGTLIRVPYGSTNENHRFECRLEDADGRPLALGDAPQGVESTDGKIRRVGSEFTVGRPPALPPGDEQLLPFALNFDGLVFEAPGRYRFVLGIDGRDITTLSFRVNLSADAGGHR